MKRLSHLCLFGFLFTAVGMCFVLPDVWLKVTGRTKDYDLGGLIFVGCFLSVGTVGFFVAMIWARRKERLVDAELREMGALSTTRSKRDDAFVQLDFVRTFPHTVWVSTVSYDKFAPNGFRYKMFAVRREPEMMIELLLLREMVDGMKQQVFRMEAPIEKLGNADDVIRDLERGANVEFERFDLSDVRSVHQLEARAIEAGWETEHRVKD